MANNLPKFKNWDLTIFTISYNEMLCTNYKLDTVYLFSRAFLTFQGRHIGVWRTEWVMSVLNLKQRKFVEYVSEILCLNTRNYRLMTMKVICYFYGSNIYLFNSFRPPLYSRQCRVSAGFKFFARNPNSTFTPVFPKGLGRSYFFFLFYVHLHCFHM